MASASPLSVACPDRVRDEAPHEVARRRVEAERALRDDPVDHDAEELAELVGRDVHPQLARRLAGLDTRATALARLGWGNREPALP